MGDRTSTFARALAALAELGAVDAASQIWTTAPVGGPQGQPDYLNAVVRWRPGRAWGTPAVALAALLAIETGLGRRRRVRWGPRTLDLDLLDGAGWASGGRIGVGARPTLPHPRAAERPFVLAPWAEVAPDWPAPVAARPAGDEPPVATVLALARTLGRVGVRPAERAEASAWRAAVAAVLIDARADEPAAGRG